jgi:hypothetical protein
LGFSEEKFAELLANNLQHTAVGYLGRETPLDFSSLEGARSTLLLRELFSKYDDGSPSPEKERVTWEKFHRAELVCQESNFWIPRTFRYDPFWIKTRARIRDTLGRFSWDECSKRFGFGPGATTRLLHSERFAAYKYSGIPESTSGNAILAACAIRMLPLWKHNVQSAGGDPDQLVKLVEGNRVVTVPKNFKTDRTIAKEPCMNIYIQKGIGQIIRYRLKRVGIDLSSQVGNQIAARIGSLTGELATIDLSMASDTLSTELVRFLLPNDWFEALEQCRSPIGVLPSGDKIHYQKFSSMGNGYTFELETLIFWAITQSVCCPDVNETDKSVLVYGDDIVAPSQICPELLRRLWQAGFIPNAEKTFYEGPYRESCGKHFYLGTDITPFYVRSPVRTLDRLFLVHNNLFRWSERTGVDVKQLLTKVASLAPRKWQEPRLPDGFGDGAFIGAVDELRLDSHPYGWDCWQATILAKTSKLLEDELPDGQIIASLLQLSANVFPPLPPLVAEFWGSFLEHNSGLPVREGRFREIKISIPRYPTS